MIEADEQTVCFVCHKIYEERTEKKKPGLCVIPAASVGAIQVVSTLKNNPFQTNLFADFVNLTCQNKSVCCTICYYVLFNTVHFFHYRL